MTRLLSSEQDIEALKHGWEESARGPQPRLLPSVFTAAELLALDISLPGMLIENLFPMPGASLIVGAPKSGKTLLAVQAAIAVASGEPLFGKYKISAPGAAMVLAQDDPGAIASIKEILQRSSVSATDIPFFLIEKVPFTFGDEFVAWLDGEISGRSLRLVMLDSYTALRAPRSRGVDIVKAERDELAQLDCLAKRNNCSIGIVHHGSKGSANLHWTHQAAGTFAMAASTEAQILISRFPDVDEGSPERLLRVRLRHGADQEVVLRFREKGLDYEYLLDGRAASFYPLILRVQKLFGSERFGPKELANSTGVSRATAHRHIELLHRAGILRKSGYGEYSVISVSQ